MMAFTDYQFKPFINQTLKDIGFSEETKVQKAVLERALKGDNLVVESATGSGKTHAFLLPIMQRIDVAKPLVQALILSPTRELAMQLYEVAGKFQKNKPELDIRLAIGGTNRDQEIKRFETVQPHIVIGTVGRIRDLAIATNVLKIYTSQIVVIDEADMVLDGKDLEEVDQVLAAIPKPQFMLFSATIPKPMRHFMNRYLEGVKEIVIGEPQLTKGTIEHLFIPTKAKSKEEVLLSLLKIINPFLALIFVNKVEDVDPLAKYIASHGYEVGVIHGDLDDRTRRQTLRRIKDLHYQYVVASDIASRGIDIEGVSHVINFDLPQDIEFYVHRTGRTARFEMRGQAISLYDYDDEKYVNELKKKGLNPVFVKITDQGLEPTVLKERKPLGKIKQIETMIHAKTPMPKKVKPGYKKKRKEKIEKEIRTLKREYVSSIYRKKKKYE